MTHPVTPPADNAGLDGNPADNALIEAVGTALADAVFTVEAGLARVGEDTERLSADAATQTAVLLAPTLGPGNLKLTIEPWDGSAGPRDGFDGDPCGPAGNPA